VLGSTYSGKVIAIEKIRGAKPVFSRALSERKDLKVLQLLLEMEPSFWAAVGLQLDEDKRGQESIAWTPHPVHSRRVFFLDWCGFFEIFS
jgi:hypothetical protein